jgi:hypothetical protein
MTIRSSGMSASNDTDVRSSIVGNDTLPLDGLGGEEGIDERDMDEQSLKWVDEGLAPILELSTHIDTTLYPDFFDNFGNVCG